jgi:hypothetical protein
MTAAPDGLTPEEIETELAALEAEAQAPDGAGGPPSLTPALESLFRQRRRELRAVSNLAI